MNKNNGRRSLAMSLAALMLTLAMVLTYMPMMAFAEGEEAAEDQQITETAEEAAEAEPAPAAEEAVEAEAESLEMEDSDTAKTASFIPADDFELKAVEGRDWLEIFYPGNTFVVSGTKYICAYYEEEDGSEAPAFFENGDLNKMAFDWCDFTINGSEEGVFKAGKNDVRIWLPHVDAYADITVTASPKAVKLAFTPADGFVLEAEEGEDYVDCEGIGNKFTVTYSDGSTKDFICKKYTEIDDEGNEEECLNFLEDGDPAKEVLHLARFINGAEEGEGVIQAGINNTVVFAVDDARTEALPVKCNPAPTAIEFVPASGVTLWGFAGEAYVHGNAYYAEGNQFIVTYSDGSKKIFEVDGEEYTQNGETFRFVGYFEKGKSHKNSRGEFNDVYFDTDISRDGLSIGKNSVRFGLDTAKGMVWSNSFIVIGKPSAVSVAFSPAAISARIFKEYDDIDLYNSNNKIVVTYSDKTKKTFTPKETKSPEGYPMPAFMCGDEELVPGWDVVGSSNGRLKEGKNTITLTFWGISADEDCLKCNVTVNAGTQTVCTHSHLTAVKKIAPTCQEEGLKAHYLCPDCGKVFTDKKAKKATTYKKLAIKKVKHKFKEKKIDEEHLKSAATCTKPAVYYYSCSMCHQKGSKTFKSGKALGHDFVAGSITKATAKKDGKIAGKCSRCGKTNKGVKIPKASKVFSLNKKSVVYAGEGKEKDAVSLKIKAGKYPVSAEEYDVTYSEPVYKGKKSKGTVTVTFKPECRYYSGSITLTYKITKVPKK